MKTKEQEVPIIGYDQINFHEHLGKAVAPEVQSYFGTVPFKLKEAMGFNRGHAGNGIICVHEVCINLEQNQNFRKVAGYIFFHLIITT